VLRLKSSDHDREAKLGQAGIDPRNVLEGLATLKPSLTIAERDFDK
jgi:hypothetical protein